MPAKRLTVCERWPRGAFVSSAPTLNSSSLYTGLSWSIRWQFTNHFEHFLSHIHFESLKKKYYSVPLNNLGVVSHIAYSMFSWWKKMPLCLIITGWHHQKCFSFSFGLISKKQERDNEVFVIKTQNQKKSLIIWNSDIQTFKYSFAFKSSQGSLLTINTGHQGGGIGPTKAHFCLVEYLVWFWFRWSLGHTSRNTPVGNIST